MSADEPELLVIDYGSLDLLISVLIVNISPELHECPVKSPTSVGRKRIDKEDEYSKWRIKEYDADFTTKARGEKPKSREKIITLPDGRIVTVMVPIMDEREAVLVDGEEIQILSLPEVVKKEKPKEEKKEEEPKKIDISEKSNVVEEIVINSFPKREEVDSFEEELSPKSQETLGKLKNRKIIDIQFSVII